jgi:ATP-dependent Clp protease protease subunit
MTEYKKENTIDLTQLLNNPAELSPATYQYYKNLQERTLIINDEINIDIIESAVLPLLEWDNDGSNKPIKIYFNSNGGDVYYGMTLCNVIERLRCSTEIIVLSLAASMGALIAMASHNNNNVKTKCYPFSVFLIHSGSYYFEGSANQVRDSFKFQESYEEKLKNYILTHSTISEEIYEKQTRYEWYMTAENAKEYGIVDEIL